MSATTPGALRTTIAARITALTPTHHTEVAYREHLEREAFREWAASHPSAAFRRFSVRPGRVVEGPDVSDGRYEAVWQEFEVAVAYPTDGKFGALMLPDLDNAIERDRTQIACTVGTNGAAYTDATVLTDGEDAEDIGPVHVGIVRLRVRYFRDARPS